MAMALHFRELVLVLLSILVLISTSKIPHVNFCQRKVQRHVSLESANCMQLER